MSAAVQMSAPARSARTTEPRELERALEVLGEGARRFARLPIPAKLELLERTMDRLLEVAEAWAADGSRAKGVDVEGGEELLVGPVPTMRNLRLLADTLRRIERGEGAVRASQVVTRPDGRVAVQVFPTDGLDGALFAGFRAEERMLPGVDAEAARARAGSFYGQKDPEGGVSLILGAGNVSSIPPMDMLYKSFAEGMVCLVKVNPVNEWVGPHLERAFAPFVEAGFLRVVYGGADVGRHLVEHPRVDDVHITGSNHTHDLIVWGPPGPERERRKAAREPLLAKPITSELGNVSPVVIVPAPLSAAELDFVARNVAAMVTNNASFNCNAAKLLVTSRGWPQREALLARIAEVLEETPTRLAYYPGARDRYAALTAGRAGLRQLGRGSETHLPWAIIPDVDPAAADDPVFSTEPFCGLISETALAESDPEAFLAAAAAFLDRQVWGTLNAMLVVPPALERSASFAAALDRAIDGLRYGSVTVNHWPGLVYGLTSPAWGGHPSATLEDVQSGIGWVHNTYLLEGIEKTVLRGPFTVFPKPAWFGGHRTVAALARRLLRMERKPSWLGVPGIALTGLRG